MELHDQAKELRELKDYRDALKKQYEEADQQFQIKQRDLLDRMDEEDVHGLKVDGTNFVPSETVYGQIQDRSEFVEWAEVHEPELLEKKERKSLVNQKVREHLDDGKPLPPGLGFYVKEYISHRAG